MSKDLKDLFKALRKQGFPEPVKTRSNHWKVFDKDGRWVVTLSNTASDHRGLKNALADLRRAGFDPPTR